MHTIEFLNAYLSPAVCTMSVHSRAMYECSKKNRMKLSDNAQATHNRLEILLYA